jgi:hypothetical protein
VAVEEAIVHAEEIVRNYDERRHPARMLAEGYPFLGKMFGQSLEEADLIT